MNVEKNWNLSLLRMFLAGGVNFTPPRRNGYAVGNRFKKVPDVFAPLLARAVGVPVGRSLGG